MNATNMITMPVLSLLHLIHDRCCEMATKVQQFYAAGFAAALICGCAEETVTPIDPGLQPTISTTPMQSQVTFFVPGITEKLGLY